MRGSQHVHDAVRAWECDSIEDSPMTANRETMSNLQPESLPFLPIGNQFDMLAVFQSYQRRLRPSAGVQAK